MNSEIKTEVEEQLEKKETQDKRLLPLVSEVSGHASNTLGEPETVNFDVTEKIAHAFLHSKFPLSRRGEQLKMTVERLLKDRNKVELSKLKSQLPTVENPNLELFADLNITPEDEEKFFGDDLTNIQVTKGCSHKCSFCAISARPKVDFMPFAAILKIATKKRKRDNQYPFQKNWDEARAKIEGKPHVFVDGNTALLPVSLLRDLRGYEQEWQKAFNYYKDSFENFLEVIEICQANPETNGILKLLGINEGLTIEEYIVLIEKYSKEIKDFLGKIVDGNQIPDDHIKKIKIFMGKCVPASCMGIRKKRGREIYNYYDSDVFDYRDTSFLHEDGTPADYGDVVAALATETRPIHITTAGWGLHDKVAARAAKKVKKSLDQGKIYNLRISINPTEMTAATNPDKYVQQMKAVIDTFGDTEDTQQKIKVLWFYASEEDDFYKKVVVPLQKHTTSYRNIVNKKSLISNFSGHHVDKGTVEKNEKHGDIMQCMPGFHIWPNGEVLRQRGGVNGDRPQKMDINIFPD